MPPLPSTPLVSHARLAPVPQPNLGHLVPHPPNPARHARQQPCHPDSPHRPAQLARRLLASLQTPHALLPRPHLSNPRHPARAQLPRLVSRCLELLLPSLASSLAYQNYQVSDAHLPCTLS